MSQYIAVAPREGRVSRNYNRLSHFPRTYVAPREGRVSRNLPVPHTARHSVPSRPARGV